MMAEWDEGKHPRQENGQFGSGGPGTESTKTGAFGKIFTGYRHNAAGAISKLKEEQGGEAEGALFHPEIGDIDLIWGEAGDPTKNYAGGYGLAKIMAKHPEVVDNLQEVINAMQVVGDKSGYQRVRLSSEDGKYKGVVNLKWKESDKKWLLTAYETTNKEGDVTEKTMDTSGFSGASDTALCTDIPDLIIEQKIMEFQAQKYGCYPIAMDRSMRSYDGNGHLIVESTVITKAAVNPYFGKEIPGYEALRLEPDKIYNMLRDPEELEKALSSFKGVQLLIKHTPVSAEEPHNNLTVGSVGTDIAMSGRDVTASLRVYDKDAIDLIESGKLQELSAGYSYTADMTPGEFDGHGYDGVMRNIHGNHVALVERGRIGRDAIISDSMSCELMEQSMKLKKGAIAAITAELQSIAMDGDITPDVVKGVVKAVADNMVPTVPKTEDEEADLPQDEDVTEDEDETEGKEKSAEDEDETEKTEDESPDSPEGGKEKPAMDADAIEAAAVKRVTALFEAREAVKPLVGAVTMDSAEAVYGYALKQKGVDIKGVHPSAYRAMVGLLSAQKQKPAVAMDADFGVEDKLTARFK